ncbi:MAG: type II toxin-antitoxin system Phd/YefM family antitoxin [Bacillota bacterium]
MSLSVKIRPLTDLAKNIKEIENLCIKQDLPVFITKKGSDYLTIMSHEHYNNLIAKLEQLTEQVSLYEKLLVAEGESRRGEMLDFNEVMDKIDNELKEQIANDDNRRVSG